VRVTELTRAHRRRLTRYAHQLARSGKYDSAEAVISAIRGHTDFDSAWHEAGAFRTALDAICAVAKKKREGHFRMTRQEQTPSIAA
jgi:hypothetical protein